MSEQTLANLPIKYSLEVAEFTNKHAISERETDILILLINGITTSTEISEFLGLSPNTVSNHLKSILTKTFSHSKTEVVAAFTQHCVKKLENLKYYVRPPTVLFVDDDEDFCELAKIELEARGIRVITETDPHKVEALLITHCPDAVLSDIVMPRMNGMELVRRLNTDINAKAPYILMTGYDHHGAEECRQMGAAELFIKPFNFSKLAFVIFENFIENPHLKSRFGRVPCQIAVSINKSFNGTIDNLSSGGAFINLTEVGIKRRAAFQPGKNTELSFKLSQTNQTITLSGRISWQRKRSMANLPTGIGVEFIDVNAKDLEMLNDYVRTHKNFPGPLDLK